MSIQTRLHLWWAWMQIAMRHVAQAARARNEQVTPYSFESEASAKLSVEFQSSLAAIAAVAFAMESLAKELKANGHIVDESRFVKPEKTNAGFFIAQRLIQAFDLSDEFAVSLPARLEQLFALRNDSVHFESKYQNGVHHHPSGAKVAYESAVYTLEKCTEALTVGAELIRECARASEKGQVHCTCGATASEISQVAVLLPTVIQAHGIYLGR